MVSGLQQTQFHFEGQESFYKGKVRDVYKVDGKLVMIATDRISAFDVVLPRAIPYKGQVLNQIAVQFLKETEDIVPNWLLSSPDPNVSIGLACEPFKVEMVIRGYLTGHAWRTYRQGLRSLCGEPMPDGMRENDRFPKPIITPTTKASEGHDEDISKEEILEQGLVSEEDYQKLEHYTHLLYKRGAAIARKQGLILVDTKYEFGKLHGQIYLIDEVHTPDSSRYFYLDTYESLLESNQPQRQLSKEFVRQWLIENNFMGKEGQSIPPMSDEWVETISNRYIELYEKVMGMSFEKRDYSNLENQIFEHIRAALV